MATQDQVRHSIDGDKFSIEMNTNRFTYDLVDILKNLHPFDEISKYNTVEINLEQVKMIDSSSIGFLFELHNKLKNEKSEVTLIVNLGNNTELKKLFHKFQVDLLLKIK